MTASRAAAAPSRSGFWAPCAYVLAGALNIAAFLKIAEADPLSSVGQAQSVYEPLLLAICCALLFMKLRGKVPWRLLLTGPLAAVAVYAAYAGLSFIWSLDAVLTLGKSIELVLSLANAVLLATAIHEDGLDASFYLYCALAVLVAVTLFLGFNQVLYGTPLWFTTDAFDPRERLWLGYTHPLTVADLASLGIICALLARTARLPRLGLIVAFALVLYLTQSRGATVGIALAVLAYVISGRKSGAALTWRFAFLVTLGMLMIGAVVAMVVSDSEYLADLPPEVATLNGRVDLWAASLDFALADPLRTLFGYGYYASRFVLLDSFDWGGHTHQVLLEVLLTTGVIGLAIFGWFVAGLLRLSMVDAGLLTVTAYVIAVGFDNPILFQPGVPMTVVMWSIAHVLHQRRGVTASQHIRALSRRPTTVAQGWTALTARANPHRP